MSKILITGGAGFIGSHVAEVLIESNDIVIVDNFNDYYAVSQKEQNVKRIQKKGDIHVYKADIRDKVVLKKIVTDEKPQKIIHLAALCGVRNSLVHPQEYFETNVMGTDNLLEAAKETATEQIIVASSSSVYGNFAKVPFVETETNLSQENPYASSKFQAEEHCKAQSSLPITILRFFTVYGPYGRPDMAPYIFTKAILNDEPITTFGNPTRDYTHITDIVKGIRLTVERNITHETINLGSSHPVTLTHFIEIIEKAAGKKAKKIEGKQNSYEMTTTYADITKAKNLLGWQPQFPLESGIRNLVAWMQNH